jgi:alpha-galactosidase
MSNYQLQNNFFILNVFPEFGNFNLKANRIGLASFEGASLSVSLQKGKRAINLLRSPWNSFQLMRTTADSPHGKLRQLEFSIFLEEESLIVRLTFAISDEQPLFLWKVLLENQSNESVTVETIELLNIGCSRNNERNSYHSGNESSKPAYSFYSSGWQSWSFTGTFRDDQIQRQTRLKYLQDVMVQNPGTPLFRQQGHFSSDFFGVLADRNARTACLFGFLSQKNHYGSIEVDIQDQPKIRMWANGDQTILSPSYSIETDWAVIYANYFDQPDAFATFYNAVKIENNVTVRDSSPAGWCSWYYYYQKISEKTILHNLENIQAFKSSLPLELVQIDDGFEKQVGDWYSFTKEFPNGVQPLAEEIKKKGFLPGLWLAPFIVHPNSDYAISNPEKLLRNKHGQTVNAGFGWNTFTQAIDLTVPGALEDVLGVMETAAKTWGFPYLKLDFLYAGALKGKRFDQTKTRAQIMRNAMLAIREKVGQETFLLGCGAPLGSVIGIVDANRIGADVSPDWIPKFAGISFPFKREPHMPSARNSIQNILSRAEQHGRWWINDPDCLLVRDNTNLTLAEVQSLSTAIAITGGSILVSDDLPLLSPERRKIAEKLLPVIGKRAYIMDWLDKTTPHNIRLDLKNQSGNWNLLARFNWKETPREVFVIFPDFNLPKMNYWAFSFWNQKVSLIHAGDPIQIPQVEAHGVALIALREVTPNPTYLGSDLHISMGLEISEWSLQDKQLTLQMQLPRATEGSIFLYLPQSPQEILVNEMHTTWEELPDNVFKVFVAFDQNASITITW